MPKNLPSCLPYDDPASRIAQAKMRKVIKAWILKLCSVHGSCHGDLLLSTDEFAVYLNGADGWLFLDKCNNATPEEMELQWDNNQLRTEVMCAVFYAAERKHTLEKDREMEEGLGPLQPSTLPLREEGDNHETRQLPTKCQMEIVMKNKNKANKLFSGKNYLGAARYACKANRHVPRGGGGG